jgi:hypothetical protein
VIPTTIDLLAVRGALALQLPELNTGSRKHAGTALTVAVIVSVAANIAGGNSLVARLAHAWPVIAYLLGGLLAKPVRTHGSRLRAAETTP